MTEPTRNSVTGESYDVFLSHAHADRQTAREIVKALGDVGVKVFDASSEPGVLWGSDLYAVLNEVYPERTHAAMVLLSRDFTKSNWCAKELDLFIRRNEEVPNLGFILPVRLDEAPLPNKIEDVLYVDLRTTEVNELARLTKKKLDDWKRAQYEVLAALSDEELLQRVARERNTEAFSVLHERLYPVVRRYLESRIREGPDSDDLALDVMLRLWEKADLFDPKHGPMRPWLLMMARNAAVDHMRRLTKRQTVHLVDDAMDVSSDTVLASIRSKELMAGITNAVDSLTDSERQILNLYLAGTPPSEIAKLLNITAATARVRQHRVMDKLRRALGEVRKSE